MKRKTLNTFSILCLCFMVVLMTGCSKSSELLPDVDRPIKEPVNELKLSAKWNVDIEDVEYEFEILDGNGGYMGSVAGQDAGRVVIEGNKVKVSLLKNQAAVTITDKEQQSETVIINSTAKSLISNDYYIFIDNGDTYTMKDVSFGVGGYTIKKIRGTSAEVSVDENDYVKVTALNQGNSYYQLTDTRGTTASLDVMVTANYYLVENNIKVTAVNDQTFSVILKYGNGGWKVTTREPYSPLIDKVYIMPKGDQEKKYDILQVNTTKGNLKGRATLELKDKDGNIALISITVN